MKWRSGLLAICLALVTVCAAAPEDYLIPLPREIHWGTDTFQFESPVRIMSSGSDFNAERDLRDALTRAGLTSTTNDQVEARLVIALGRSDSGKLSPESEAVSANLPNQGYYLEIARRNGRVEVALNGSDPQGTYYAAQTLIQLLRVPGPMHTVQIWDYPAFARERGYGEFFYGEPWTHDQRRDAVDFMRQLKMNYFMYSPKDDPYNRDRWRDDYPAEDLQRMKDLNEFARGRFITFCFAINPGLSIKYSSDEDFGILMHKYDQMIDLGMPEFSLQIDDIGNAVRHEEDAQRFKNQGEAHAFLVNRVYNALKERGRAKGFSTCGMMYYIAQPDEYVRSFGELVDLAIPIMWTGGEVVDDYISISEVYQIAGGLKRLPYVSDNYPVNDFAQERLFMGPLTGRPGILVDHVYNGFLENPMALPEASKIGIATDADYTWNPYAYDPERSFNAAIRLVVGDEGFDAMRLFCENNRSSVMEKRESIELARLIRAYLHANHSAQPTAAQNLKEYLWRMRTLPPDLLRTVHNEELLQEIEPWSKKVSAYGMAGILALSSLDSRRSLESRWRDRALLQAMRTHIQESTPQVCGFVPERLINHAIYGTSLMSAKTGGENGAGGVEPLEAFQNNTLDMMFDDDEKTAFIGHRPVSAGDWIQVTLDKPRRVSGIHVVQAGGDSADAYIHSGILEYTMDGRTWIPAVQTQGPDVQCTSAVPMTMRAARLRATASQSDWVRVPSFDIDFADAPKVSGNLGATSDTVAVDTALQRAGDGRESTWWESGAPIRKGQSLQLDWGGREIKADRVELLLGSLTINGTVIETSRDGRHWKKAGEVKGRAVSIPLKGRKITAVRLRATADRNVAVRIHELRVIEVDDPS